MMGNWLLLDYIRAFMYHILRVHPINLVYYCCDWPHNATGFVVLPYPLYKQQQQQLLNQTKTYPIKDICVCVYVCMYVHIHMYVYTHILSRHCD